MMSVPWKSDPFKKARCGMCKKYDGYSCKAEKELKYPLIINEHNCRDYEYNSNSASSSAKYLRSKTFYSFTLFTHCNECTFEFEGMCSGQRWIPVKTVDGKCEFFKPKSVACKNCVPMLQYGNNLRNNYCRLPPHLRDGDARGGWKYMCPGAHDPERVGHLKCYKPLSSA